MDEALLLAILKDVVVPEVSSFISAYYAKTGELPTQEEIQAQVDSLASTILTKANNLVEQVLKDHPELASGTTTKDS